jgi:hypothetical protein
MLLDIELTQNTEKVDEFKIFLTKEVRSRYLPYNPFAWSSRIDELIYSDRNQNSGCLQWSRGRDCLERGRKYFLGQWECPFILKGMEVT